MKKILSILGIAALVFAACTPDSGNDTKLPSASGITPVVTVADNVATFSLPEGTTGLIPIWYTNETGDFVFAGSGNGYQKTFYEGGTFKVRMYVSNSVGQSEDYSEAEFTIEVEEGWNGYNYNSQYNIWKVGEDAGMSDSWTYYNPDPNWGAVGTFDFTASAGVYSFTLAKQCYSQWQAQLHLVPGAAVALSSDKKYDFSCLVTVNKLCGGVTFKLVEQGNDDLFLFVEQQDMQEGTNIFYMKGVSGVDIAAAKMVFDFGWCAEGTEVTISRITLKDHANDDGTNAPDKAVPGADALDTACTINADAATNIFDLTDLAGDIFFYYAPGWVQIANPEMSGVSKTGFTLTCPTATDSRWQNQVGLNLNVNLSAAKTYDFSCTINSNNAFQYGVKLTNHADDAEIFFHDCQWHTALTAGQDCTFTIANLAGKDIPAKIFFDFGGNPENTTIVVKNICLQEHID